MGMMIVRHKVRDYGQWRPIFDQPCRNAEGGGAYQSTGLSFRRQQ